MIKAVICSYPIPHKAKSSGQKVTRKSRQAELVAVTNLPVAESPISCHY